MIWAPLSVATAMLCATSMALKTLPRLMAGVLLLSLIA
jgi:hypothetical protein